VATDEEAGDQSRAAEREEPAAARARQAQRRRRHLMDPANPVPRRQDPMSLSQVQKWILSSLATLTILHLAAGFALAAVVNDRQSSQIGLLVIAAVTGVLAVMAGLVIHGRRVLSWWPLLGLLPALAATWWLVAAG
jgi:hypothetical protein